MKKSQFLDFLNALAAELSQFRLNLETLCHAMNDNLTVQNESQILITEATEILKIIQRLEKLEILVLIDQDYTDCCMMLLYGSLMAEYLKKIKRISRNKLKYAQNWHELEKTFKPILEENLRLCSSSNIK